jgi:membrane protein DedA with SNARE-associated domain
LLGLLPISPAAKAYLALVLSIWAASAGVPIPEEVPLLTGGVLAALGVVDLWAVIVVGLLACFTGDLVVYILGRRIGMHLDGHRVLSRLMRARALRRARVLYVKRGPWALFIARWLPGLKMPFLFTAGALRMPWRRFLLYDIASISLLVPAIVLLAYHSSFTLPQLQHALRNLGLIGTGAFLAALALGVLLWHLRRRRRALEAETAAKRAALGSDRKSVTAEENERAA